MSKSTTPAYRAFVTPKIGFIFTVVWDCRTSGRPTDENALKWLKSFNDSLLPGGANAHLAGYGYNAVSIKIVRNNTEGEPVAFASL